VVVCNPNGGACTVRPAWLADGLCVALQVEIMMALEEQFDITLDEEGAEKISTVQEAADMIAAQM